MIEPGTIPSALLGGAIIGVAAVMMLALNGRIMGVSGIAAGLLSQQTSDKALRLLFLVGMVVGGLIVARLLPAAMPGAVASLLEMLDGMTLEMRDYKGFAMYEDALRTFVARSG